MLQKQLVYSTAVGRRRSGGVGERLRTARKALLSQQSHENFNMRIYTQKKKKVNSICIK
jgi:hypothetical protein